jgi:hypothetical protein
MDIGRIGRMAREMRSQKMPKNPEKQRHGERAIYNQSITGRGEDCEGVKKITVHLTISRPG